MADVLGKDIQQGAPTTRVALSRVGVTGLKRILRLRAPDGEAADDTLFFAEMDLFAHLDARQAGVHMSRFIENIEDAAAELATAPSPDIETLAERMAAAIAHTQGAARAEARIRAQYPMAKRTPVSDLKVEDLYTFIGIAVSNGTRTRRAVGVEVSGLTVCPCAREMVSEHARGLLADAGYTAAQAAEIVSLLPLASHNQRGIGTLIVGTDRCVRAEDLAAVVENAMSSEIYELLKRPDELHVVRKGHMRPRFVEDVVREIIRGVVERMPTLPDDTFLLARQENFESIHTHNAYAERSGLLGDMRAEIADRAATPPHPTSLEAWLEM